MGEMSLRSFVAQLEQEQPGEILRVSEQVPQDFFLTSLEQELSRQQKYPLLILDNVEGAGGMPVVGNLFGTRERIARILNTTQAGFNSAWLEREESPIQPVVLPTGPVKEIVQVGDQVDLYQLPIARHFLDDAGPYISSGIVVAKDPDSGTYNMSFHRMQLKARDKFGISLHSRAHLWDYFRRAAEKGQDLEVAIIIGCHPAYYLAAACKVGMDVDEYALTGGLLGQGAELTPAQTIDLLIPANAEIVLEGKIIVGADEPEGPFGEYTGYSTSRSTRNVFKVSAVCRRKTPYYLDLVPGYSNEHLLLGRVAKEAHVFARLKEVVPTLKAINFPKSGTHFHAYMSFKKTEEGQARHALMLLLGLDSYLKLVVAVDEDVDVFNEEEVLWAMATRMQADKDVFIVPSVFCNKLDPSAREGVSAKMAIDATAPLEWDVIRCRTNPATDGLVRKLLGDR